MGTTNIVQDGSNNTINNTTKRNLTIKIGSTIVIVGIICLIIIGGSRIFSSKMKNIVGTWQTEGGMTYVFNEDGQYAHDGGWFGSYTIDGDTLTLSPPLNNPEIYKIEISSDILILYNEDGSLYQELHKYE